MNDDVRSHSVRIAGLYAHGRTPTPAELADAKRRLAVAKIDREVRRAQADALAPDAVDTAHLVGLLLMWGGSPDGDAERAKRAVREVVYVLAHRLTDDDRAELAELVTKSGDA